MELEGPNVRIHFLGAPGEAYVLETSPDLTTWNTLVPLTTDVAGRATFTDLNPPPGARFYRVRCP